MWKEGTEARLIVVENNKEPDRIIVCLLAKSPILPTGFQKVSATCCPH